MNAIPSKRTLPVREICDERNHNGIQQYRVRWADTSDAEASWIDEDKLQNCDDLLLRYKKIKKRRLSDPRRFQTHTATFTLPNRNMEEPLLMLTDRGYTYDNDA